MVVSSDPQQPSLLSGLCSALKSTFTCTLSTLISIVDQKIPPSRRAAIKSRTYAFAQDRPVLASFLASQLVCSGVPLFLLILQIVSVLFFSFATAIVIGSICALIFTSVCVGLALLVLVPILIVTTFAGLTVWVWAWIGWYVLDWTGVMEWRRTVGNEKDEKRRKNGGDIVTVKEVVEKTD